MNHHQQQTFSSNGLLTPVSHGFCEAELLPWASARREKGRELTVEIGRIPQLSAKMGGSYAKISRDDGWLMVGWWLVDGYAAMPLPMVRLVIGCWLYQEHFGAGMRCWWEDIPLAMWMARKNRLPWGDWKRLNGTSFSFVRTALELYFILPPTLSMFPSQRDDWCSKQSSIF